MEREVLVRDMQTLTLSTWWLCRKAPFQIPLTSIEFQTEGRNVDVCAVVSIAACQNTVRRLLLGKKGNTHHTLSSLSWLSTLTDLRELDLKSASIRSFCSADNGGKCIALQDVGEVLPVLERLVVGDYFLPGAIPLQQLKCLRDVDLSGTGIGDEAVVALGSCRHLRRVRVAGCERVRHFHPLGNLDRLEEIDCAGTHVGDSCLTVICDGCPRLQSVALAGCNDMHDFSCLGCLTELEVLDVSRTRINTSAIRSICTPNSQMRALNLGSVVSQIQDLSPLRHVAAYLTELYCSYSPFDDDAIEQVSGCTNVEVLSLRCCYRVENFSPLTKLPYLRYLDVTGTTFGDRDLEAVAACRQLEVLHLQSCHNIRNFAALGTLSSLNELNVSDTNFDDSGLHAIQQCQALAVLMMHFCIHVRDVSSLARLPSLSSVGLGCLKLRDADWAMLRNRAKERGIHINTQVLLLHPPF